MPESLGTWNGSWEGYIANVNRHILLSGLVSALLMFISSFSEPGLGPLSLVLEGVYIRSEGRNSQESVFLLYFMNI